MISNFFLKKQSQWLDFEVVLLKQDFAYFE